jgi:hypothetical protein
LIDRQAIPVTIQQTLFSLRNNLREAVTHMNELFLPQTLGNLFGATEIWLAVAYVVCMFAILAFKPQQIENAVFFRLSYILFALHLILPAVVNAVTSLSMMDGGGMRPRGDSALFVFQFTGVFGKILLGLSIVFGLSAMNRRRVVEENWERDADRDGP